MIWYIAGYIIISLLIGAYGSQHKFGFWGYFFGSLLFSPFIGLILVAASDRLNPEPEEEQ